MARLRLTTESAQLIWPLSDRFTIGRDETNSLALQGDSAVSREHLLIESTASGFVLNDRGSANGTLLERQGRKWRVVGEVVLKHGDAIEIGNTRLVFEDEMPDANKVDPNMTVRGRIVPVETTESRDVLP